MLKRILAILEVKKEHIPTEAKNTQYGSNSTTAPDSQILIPKPWIEVSIANSQTYFIVVAPGRFKVDITDSLAA